MTVKELKKLLNSVPDTASVSISCIYYEIDEDGDANMRELDEPVVDVQYAGSYNTLTITAEEPEPPGKYIRGWGV
jgi:hypothetical protein